MRALHDFEDIIEGIDCLTLLARLVDRSYADAEYSARFNGVERVVNARRHLRELDAIMGQLAKVAGDDERHLVDVAEDLAEAVRSTIIAEIAQHAQPLGALQ